jgi:hypothetical protein
MWIAHVDGCGVIVERSSLRQSAALAIGRDAVLGVERLVSGVATDRYTLGVGERRPSTSTPVDDVFRHLSTSLTGRIDGIR